MLLNKVHISARNRPLARANARSKLIVKAYTRNETAEDATERRVRESQRVDERVQMIFNEQDFVRALENSGNDLVVLEVSSDEVCETGLTEEAENQWKRSKSQVMAPCAKVKHAFQRIARDCPDVRFLTLVGDATAEAQDLTQKLRVKTFPTVQFYQDRRFLWEHRGHLAHDTALGEGVMYYGNVGAQGTKTTDYVAEVHSLSEAQAFVASVPRDQLAVLDVSAINATPCIKVFPAVLALAKNFVGQARFARFMLNPATPEGQAALRELGILEAPTFMFYRGGVLQHKFVGSSRADLLGQCLKMLPGAPADSARF